jgi:hypothetical protein
MTIPSASVSEAFGKGLTEICERASVAVDERHPKAVDVDLGS